MRPRLVYSLLGRRVYVVTRYVQKIAPNGKAYLVASRKYDVTDDYRALRQKRVRVGKIADD